MITPIELNFNPSTKPEMFGVTVERAKEIIDHIAGCCARATVHYKESYCVEGKDEFAGKYRLHEGKVMQEFLEVAETLGEWAFIIFNANEYFEEIRGFVQTPKINITIAKL